jgi:L-amino acid N-acyltransferase YncA
MQIHTSKTGDEAAQVAIYNEAAGSLPNFKPATVPEVEKRTRARDFDPGSRFYVEENGRVVGYASFQANGRVSYPWLLPGQEHFAEPLFAQMLQTMRARGMKKAFTAYRADWTSINDFFLKHGFIKVRDMINYVLDLVEMPTPPARPSSSIAPVEKDDVPAILDMGRDVIRLDSASELEKYFFHNPFFSPEALFLLRSRADKTPIAVGILVVDPKYADPNAVNAAMPCYRLGAFGTEGMTTKRINGLFSFLVRADQNITALGLDLMGHAAYHLRETDDLATLAAQVPSDAQKLAQFYQRNFRRQGSFPVLERELFAD